LKRPQEEIACYNRALELDPRFALAWYGKGFALGFLDKPEEGIACLRKFIKLAPPHLASNVGMAKVMISHLSDQR